jgi:hypothetical protein
MFSLYRQSYQFQVPGYFALRLLFLFAKFQHEFIQRNILILSGRFEYHLPGECPFTPFDNLPRRVGGKVSQPTGYLACRKRLYIRK